MRAFAAERGASRRVVAAIGLAVGEAVTNAVVHGYDGAGGEVRVEVDFEEGEIEVVVADGGRGFTTTPTEGLGLGLAFVRAGATAFEVRDRTHGGVEVWMRFALEDASASSPSGSPGSLPNSRRRIGIQRSTSPVGAPTGSPLSSQVPSSRRTSSSRAASSPIALDTVGRRAPTSWPSMRCESVSGITTPPG